ncbi:MAG TPA: hypothetical protein VK985_05400 [Rariglobus sp.]|nr:hypothetical protein [Rariglobus sp.]
MALRFRHLTLLAVGLLSFWLAPLRAQTPSAKDDRSFTVYSPVPSPAWDKLFYLAGAKDPVKLTFQNNRRSVPIKPAGAPKPLVFVVENIDPATQKKTYVPVAEAAWPEAASKALVVFTVAGGVNPQVQAVAVDDGLKAFPLRSVRFFNTTGVTLLAKAADFQGEVLRGISPSHLYPVPSNNSDIVGVFPLAFAINDSNEGAKLLFTGNGDVWPLGRSLIFILPPAQGLKEIQIRVLVDAPLLPKE